MSARVAMVPFEQERTQLADMLRAKAAKLSCLIDWQQTQSSGLNKAEEIRASLNKSP